MDTKIKVGQNIKTTGVWSTSYFFVLSAHAYKDGFFRDFKTAIAAIIEMKNEIKDER